MSEVVGLQFTVGQVPHLAGRIKDIKQFRKILQFFAICEDAQHENFNKVSYCLYYDLVSLNCPINNNIMLGFYMLSHFC